MAVAILVLVAALFALELVWLARCRMTVVTTQDHQNLVSALRGNLTRCHEPALRRKLEEQLARVLKSGCSDTRSPASRRAEET